MTRHVAAGWSELGLAQGPFEEAALDLHEVGLCPIPIGGDKDKTPLVRGFTSWHRRPGVEAITDWIAKFPDSNVGIACGLSGVTIIDIDDPKIVDDMIERFGRTPLITSTPSGGVHLWFRSNGEKDRNLRRYGLSVDVKGTGGLVVVPPSVRRSRDNVEGCYDFITGSWMDLHRLPFLRAGSLSFDGGEKPHEPSGSDGRVTEGN